MNINITINKCSDCKYSSHSGAFTPGGAINICMHNSAPKQGKVSGVKGFMDITTKEIAEAIFNPCKIDLITIPDWCPLKHGLPY